MSAWNATLEGEEAVTSENEFVKTAVGVVEGIGRHYMQGFGCLIVDVVNIQFCFLCFW
jgi:hypothetical protein